MTDIKAAAAAYNTAANIARPDTNFMNGGTSTDVGPDFSEMVGKALGDVADSMGKAETHSLNSLAGKATLDDVALSLTGAELSIKALLGIRDRVISAYQDIIKMPI